MESSRRGRRRRGPGPAHTPDIHQIPLHTNHLQHAQLPPPGCGFDLRIVDIAGGPHQREGGRQGGDDDDSEGEEEAEGEEEEVVGFVLFPPPVRGTALTTLLRREVPPAQERRD